MIYTVTFNPALDYVVRVTDFRLGATNRCEREELYCGGKGINVSLVLHELGIQNAALGFIAGFTGAALKQELDARGIDVYKRQARHGCGFQGLLKRYFA